MSAEFCVLCCFLLSRLILKGGPKSLSQKSKGELNTRGTNKNKKNSNVKRQHTLPVYVCIRALLFSIVRICDNL